MTARAPATDLRRAWTAVARAAGRDAERACLAAVRLSLHPGRPDPRRAWEWESYPWDAEWSRR
jgi:hypothetical protein